MLRAMLASIALMCIAASAAGAVVFARRAPAAAVSLAGLIVGAIVGYNLAAADGPRNVPADTILAASIFMGLAGLVGLVFLKGRQPAASLRRSAAAAILAAPFAAAFLTFALLSACPLYVTRDAGFCYYDFDLLGGWVTGVVGLFGIDLMFLAAVLFVSARQAEELTEVEPG